MKRLLGICLLVLMVLGLTSCAGVLGNKLSTPQIIKHETRSSVTLVFYDETNTDDGVSDITPYCSAVWVDGTHILTAFHCMKVAYMEQQRKQIERENNAKAKCEGLTMLLTGCDPDAEVVHKKLELKHIQVHYVQQQEASGIGREPQAWHLARLVGWDSPHDLALLDVDPVSAPAHEVAEVADAVPGMGEPVHVVGSPKGFYFTYLEGTVAGYRGSIPNDPNVGPYLQIQCPVYYGNSGGGAYDSYGKLVGIADAMPGLPAEGLFIPVDTIRSFLQLRGVLERPAQ